MSPKAALGITALVFGASAIAYKAGVLSVEHVLAPSWPEIPESPSGYALPKSEPLPAQTVAELAAISTDFAQTYAAYRLAAQVDEQALLALIEDAQHLLPISDRYALTSILIGRYTELDPEATLDFLAGANLENKLTYYFGLFNSWSKVDLDAALAAASGLGDELERRAAREAILAAYSEAGQQMLADINERLTRPGTRTDLPLETVLRMAIADPESAIREAMTLTGYDTLRMTTEIGRLWASSDPEAALRFSRTMENATYRRRVQTGIFNVWAVRDPERMVELLDENPSISELSAIVDAGVLQLARRNPATALRLVLEIETARAREDSLYRVATTWAEIDPVSAAAAMEQVDSVNIVSLLGNIGTQYARRSPAGALEWAARLAENREDIGAGNLVLAAVTTEVARRDPALALDYALAIEETGNRQNSVNQVVAAIAQEDPDLATTLWQQLPVEFRPSAVMNIALQWAAQDPAAAERWITSMPPGPERSAAIGPLLSVARGSTYISDYPRLVNLLESEGERNNYGNARIAQLVREGNIAGAEFELGRLNLSSEAYDRARNQIDTAR